MNRWKSILLNHWRLKLASLVVATLVWLALRHAIRQGPSGFTSAHPIPNVAAPGHNLDINARLALAFQGLGVEKLTVVFPSFYVES